MNKYFILILVLICFDLPLIGQQFTQNLQSTNGDWDKSRFVSLVNSIDNAIRDERGSVIQLSDVEGSMYNNREFRNGQVYLGKKLEASFAMRYNAYSDEFEVKKDVSDDVLGLTKSSALIFVLDGRRYVYMNYLDKDDNLVQGHLQILDNNGKYKLYTKNAKLFKEGKKAQTSYHPDIPHKFIDSESFYLARESLNPKSLNKSKKTLQSIIAEEEWDDAKKFVKENKIQFDNRYDLIRLVEFLNSQS